MAFEKMQDVAVAKLASAGDRFGRDFGRQAAPEWSKFPAPVLFRHGEIKVVATLTWHRFSAIVAIGRAL